MNEQEQFDSLLTDYGLFQPDELYKVICPFHGDKNASMQINRRKQFFYCYGCGCHGSSLELIKEFAKLEGKELTDLQAMLQLKKKHTRPTDTKYTPTFVDKVDYKEGLQIAKDFYFNLPETNWYKPRDDEGLEAKHYMRRRGFTASALRNAEAKVSYNQWYPIVFPMFENGVFRGYVMRTFDTEIEAKRKYMYNKGFKRERCLPGTYGTKHGNSSVVLVEGFLDKIKANQIGIKNAAAILGWKLSAKQIEKLKRSGINLLICATDNDEAGDKGYKYMLRIAKVNGFKVKRLRYPKGCKDMGDVKPKTKQAEMVLTQIEKFEKSIYTK